MFIIIRNPPVRSEGGKVSPWSNRIGEEQKETLVRKLAELIRSIVRK